MKQPKNQRVLDLIRKDTYPHLYEKEGDKKDKK
jgi:hypothetical protein